MISFHSELQHTCSVVEKNILHITVLSEMQITASNVQLSTARDNLVRLQNLFHINSTKFIFHFHIAIVKQMNQ